MKILKLFVFTAFFYPLILLCSCASYGDKFSAPPADRLEFGKLAPADAITLFGKPRLTTTKITPDGNYEVYKYTYAQADISAVSSRVLLLEFKEGKLNGYFYWSSFNADKTKVNLSDVDKLKAGFGKLTRDDVAGLMGKPDGKALCPSILADFKDRCAKNTEVWGWYMTDNISLWTLGPQKVKTEELYVSFDNSGKISGVDLAGANRPDK